MGIPIIISSLVRQIDTGNTRLFTGREYDGETGLYYYRARYYSSELGRFISRDPIGVSDDVNLYGYVGNNVVNFSDPEGLMVKQAIVIGGKALVGAFIGYIGGVEIAGDDQEENTRHYEEYEQMEEIGSVINPKSAIKGLEKKTVEFFGKTFTKITKNEEVRKTLKRIEDKVQKYSKDGTEFKNVPPKGKIDSLLPKKESGYYKEYTVDTPGSNNRGVQRIVTGKNGETYYSGDHYDSFIQIK